MNTYTDAELLIEFMKHHELVDIELMGVMCKHISCSTCKINNMCYNREIPIFNIDSIDYLKKNNPELMI